MEENKSLYWENKVFINRGTLRDFSSDYEKVNGGDNQFATASQLFPTGQTVKNDLAEDGMEYEYLIYYKVKPQDNRQLNKDGKIEVVMTEKEGRAQDPEVVI